MSKELSPRKDERHAEPGQPRSSLAEAGPVQGDPDPVSDNIANHLRETAAPVFMYASMAGILQQTDLAGFKVYRDRLVADCGSPTDPIEVMLIEQIALAHMNIGRLQFSSATARSIEAARAFGAMATQLLGEFRRTALASRRFRLSSGRDRVTPASAAGITPLDSKLVSTEESDHGDGTVPFPAEKPEEGGRRASERAEAQRTIA